MTIDERIERLGHVVAGHIDQAKKDYEENRRFVRESRDDWQRQLAESKAEWDRGMAEMWAEMAARDKVTDKRIGDLVSAIGEFIQSVGKR
jgi:hypothetical protein